MSAHAERERLAADGRREANWKRWGTYLPERFDRVAASPLRGG